MKTIHVQMRDTKTQKMVEREIDYTNFTISNAQYCLEKQRAILLDWIEDRANQQHNTVLALVSWYVA